MADKYEKSKTVHKIAKEDDVYIQSDAQETHEILLWLKFTIEM